MLDLLLEVKETVSRHRARTLATAFSVLWGMLLLALLLGGGVGLRNGLLQLFKDDAANSIWVEPGLTFEAHEGLPAGRAIRFDPGDLAALSRIPGFENVSPRQPLPAGTRLTRGARAGVFPVYGIHPGYAAIEQTIPVSGRLISPRDVAEARPVALLGERAAELLFDREDPLEKTISIGGAPFTVIGVFTDAGGEGEVRRVYIPYSTLQRTFDSSGRVDLIVGTTRAGFEAREIRAQIVRRLAERHRFAPDDVAAVDLWLAEEEFRKLTALARGIEIAVWIVGLGTLLSGMIGVSNILFVSVRERVREFGLRRALGATAGSILRLVLVEALVLAGVAGGIGLLCGLGLLSAARSAGFETDTFRDPSLSPEAGAGALLVLLLSALVAGAFPAREAARLSPAEALRDG